MGSSRSSLAGSKVGKSKLAVSVARAHASARPETREEQQARRAQQHL